MRGSDAQRIDATQHIAFPAAWCARTQAVSIRPQESSRSLSPSADKKLQLFQMDWGIDKIARRNENCGNKRLFGLTYH
jgi:hypothetical protein